MLSYWRSKPAGSKFSMIDISSKLTLHRGSRKFSNWFLYAPFIQVLEQHLACAALEHPLSLLYDEKYFGSGMNNAITALKSKGYLISNPSKDSLAKLWSYIGHEVTMSLFRFNSSFSAHFLITKYFHNILSFQKMPSRTISIRAIEAERYIVIDSQLNETLEEIEESKAFFQV